MNVGQRTAQHAYGFRDANNGRIVCPNAAVDEAGILDMTACREVRRRGAGGHGDFPGGDFPVGREARVMRGLKNTDLIVGKVVRWDHKARFTLTEFAIAESTTVVEGIAEWAARIFSAHQ